MVLQKTGQPREKKNKKTKKQQQKKLTTILYHTEKLTQKRV